MVLLFSLFTNACLSTRPRHQPRANVFPVKFKWIYQEIHFDFSVLLMMSSNGIIFRVTGPLWGEFTGHRWMSLKRPVMQSFDIFFDLHLNKQLSKASGRRRFETLSRSLWYHCNGLSINHVDAHVWGFKSSVSFQYLDLVLGKKY